MSTPVAGQRRPSLPLEGIAGARNPDPMQPAAPADPSYYPRWDDPRINHGVQLRDIGRELLANYLNRKWGASITVHADIEGAATVLADMIERASDTPGDVRCGLNFGQLHGVCAVYVREQGKEAILFSDSSSARGDSSEGMAVQEALLQIGRDMPLYRQAVSTQMDMHSCFVQSMKAALTLTRRARDENGNWGPFLIPNLISELESGELPFMDPDEESFGFIPTRALPEIAKLAQGPARLDDHLRTGSDSQLRDSRQGLSLRRFVDAHSVPMENTGRRIAVFDYVRQKGLSYARNVDIEAWNQVILEKAGEEVWSPARQNEFAARVKALARSSSASQVVRSNLASPA